MSIEQSLSMPLSVVHAYLANTYPWWLAGGVDTDIGALNRFFSALAHNIGTQASLNGRGKATRLSKTCIDECMTCLPTAFLIKLLGQEHLKQANVTFGNIPYNADPYEAEKRQIGELWASKGNGKCVFGQVSKERDGFGAIWAAGQVVGVTMLTRT